MCKVARLIGLAAVATLGGAILAPAARAQTAVDSAGVRVVRYSAAARAPGHWTLGSTPALDLGTQSGGGPTQFYRIFGVARLSDGEVVVANGGTDQLRFFGPSGRFIRQVGGRGGGPGQFRGIIFQLLRHGDTLMAVDNGGDANVFDPQGHYLRSAGYPLIAGTTYPTRVGLLANGSVVLDAQQIRTSGSGGLAWLEVLKEGPDSSPSSSTRLFRLPAFRPAPKVHGRSRTLMFMARGEVAVGPRQICAGYPVTYTITCYGGNGRPIFEIERRVKRAPVTAAERKFVRDWYVFANHWGHNRAELEREARRIRFAGHAPAFGPLFVSRSGELWVGPFQPWWRAPLTMKAPPHAVRWRVYGADGKWLSDVTLPARFVPYEMGRDYVAGETFSADGVEHVTVWRIRR